MQTRQICSESGHCGCNCGRNIDFIHKNQQNYDVHVNPLAKVSQKRPERYIFDQYGRPLVKIPEKYNPGSEIGGFSRHFGL
jgi:hypothetical protein